MKGDQTHIGKQFIPSLLDQFFFHGPNGYHQCLVGEPAGCSIAKSKEDSVNLMFPRDAARSIAAQLIMGMSYLHSNDVCHGGKYKLILASEIYHSTYLTLADIHLHNILLRAPNFDSLNTEELYERYGKPHGVPIVREDGKPSKPHAPQQAIYPMNLNMPADRMINPGIIISDYGTSFVVSQTSSPKIHTPALYSPPEDFFGESIIKPTAADVWTLGVNLYETLGERPLFETFAWDHDDIVAEMINVLGQPPARWWNSWVNRPEFFEPDGSWITNFRCISTPVFRRLRQRLWDMSRGETPETCEWNVAEGELRALENLLRGMMTFEPAERPTAEHLLVSEYMEKWAMPAWKRQKKQRGYVEEKQH